MKDVKVSEIMFADDIVIIVEDKEILNKNFF